jgi:hypothetical protein
MKAELIDEVWVGAHFVAAIANGDISGLDPHEEGQLERWYAYYDGEHEHLTFETDPDGGESFARCDVGGLMSMCYEMKIYSLK